MAGDNKIKISADTSSIKKSILELSKDVKDLGKSKVAIFDKEQQKFLKDEATSHMEALKQKIDANNKSILTSTKLLNKEGRTLQDNLKTRQRISNMMKKQVEYQKEMQKLQTVIPSKPGIMGRTKGAISGIPGIGGTLSKMAGPMGIAAMLAGFGVSRARKAYSTFEGGIQDRVALRGRQVGDLNLNNPEEAAKAGLDPFSMRRARLQSMDIFGRAGSTQKAVTQRAAFERNFGIQRGTLAQAGQGMRQSLGGAGAEKAMMTMQAGLIASGITDEIGPFLETAAGMLTQINEKGITFNDSAMAFLADVASRPGVAAERVGRFATGIDSAIRGSSGESNAFFQQVFSNAGIGGGTLGGIQAAIRSGGFFGANTEADALLSASDKAMFKRTGIGGQNMKSIAGGTLNQLDQLFGNEQTNAQLPQEQKDAKRLQRLDFVRRTFGLKSEVEAGNVEELLKSAQAGKITKEEFKKKFENIQQGDTELGNLRKINKSAEGQIEILKSIHKSILDTAGEDLAPIFSGIDRTMMKLDATLSAIMGFFGIKTVQEQVTEATKGNDVITKEEYDNMTMGEPGAERQFKEGFRENYTANEEAISKMGDVSYASMRRDPAGHEKYMKYQDLLRKRGRFEETSSNLGIGLHEDKMQGTGAYIGRPKTTGLSQNTVTKEVMDFMKGVIPTPDKVRGTDNDMTPLLREINETQKRTAKASEETAKNSKAKGSAPNRTIGRE